MDNYDDALEKNVRQQNFFWLDPYRIFTLFVLLRRKKEDEEVVKL